MIAGEMRMFWLVGCKITDEQSRDAKQRWKSSHRVGNGWHAMVCLYRSETRAASRTALSMEYNTHEAQRASQCQGRGPHGRLRRDAWCWLRYALRYEP